MVVLSIILFELQKKIDSAEWNCTFCRITFPRGVRNKCESVLKERNEIPLSHGTFSWQHEKGKTLSAIVQDLEEEFSASTGKNNLILFLLFWWKAGALGNFVSLTFAIKTPHCHCVIHCVTTCTDNQLMSTSLCAHFSAPREPGKSTSYLPHLAQRPYFRPTRHRECLNVLEAVLSALQTTWQRKRTDVHFV